MLSIARPILTLRTVTEVTCFSFVGHVKFCSSSEVPDIRASPGDHALSGSGVEVSKHVDIS